MILRVTNASIRGEGRLHLAFNDGSQGVVEVSPLLEGPVLEALKDPALFEQMSLDPVCGTVTWPNGADFAPEALRDLLISDPQSEESRQASWSAA